MGKSMPDRNCQAKKIPMKWVIFVISCQNDMICYYRKILVESLKQVPVPYFTMLVRPEPKIRPGYFIHAMVVIMVMVILVKIDLGLGHLLTIYK